MTHFLLYQILPLVALVSVCMALGRYPICGRWAWALVLIAGMALQFGIAAHAMPSLANPDSRIFWNVAKGIETDPVHLLYRPPLYPLFLSPFSLSAAMWVQCVLKLAMALMVYRLSRLAGAGVGAALCAKTLFLVNAFWLQEPQRILDTTVFGFLFLACLTLSAETLYRPYSKQQLVAYGCLGLVVGLTTLTRQVADSALLLLWYCTSYAVLFSRGSLSDFFTILKHPKHRTKATFVLLASLCAGTLAYAGAIQNGLKTGVWKRSIAMGVNVYTHSSYYQLENRDHPEWSFVDSLLPEKRESLTPWHSTWRENIPWEINALPHEVFRALLARQVSPSVGKTSLIQKDSLLPYQAISQTDQDLTRRYFTWVRSEPMAFLHSIGNEGLRLWAKNEEYYPSSLMYRGKNVEPDDAATLTLIRIERGFIYQPLWLLALLALPICFSPMRRVGGILFLALVAYGTVLPILQLGFTRYALPMIPGWLALAAAGCHILVTLALKPRTQSAKNLF
jgi:hypothetical protein